MSDPHQASLLASNLKLFETGKYSDITIKCGGREWRAHRSIICDRSRFFAAACDGSFEESITKVIDLKEDDPVTLERVLLYLYTLEYDDGTNVENSLLLTASEQAITGHTTHMQVPETDENTEDNSIASEIKSGDIAANTEQAICSPGWGVSSAAIFSALVTNAQVYAMAEKYDIPQLKFLAKEKFLKLSKGSVVPTNFAGVVHEVLTSTAHSDRGLRDILREIFMDNISEITSYGFGAQSDEEDQLLSVLSGEGEFVFEVLSKVAERLGDLEVTHAIQGVSLQECEENIQKLEREKSRLVDRGAGLIFAINEHDFCRHCNKALQPMLAGLTDIDE